MTKREAKTIVSKLLQYIDDLTYQLKEIKNHIPEEYYYSVKGLLKAAGYYLDMAMFSLIEPD